MGGAPTETGTTVGTPPIYVRICTQPKQSPTLSGSNHVRSERPIPVSFSKPMSTPRLLPSLSPARPNPNDKSILFSFSLTPNDT